MTGTAVPGLGPGSLVIERIETLALRAPLGRQDEGSAYSMEPVHDRAAFAT